MTLRYLALLTFIAAAGCGDAAPPDGVPAPPAQGATGGGVGDEVQVVLWTPTDVRMMVSGRGALAVVDGCLAFSYRSGEAVLPVFPYGSTTWDPATETLTSGGKTYGLGDTLRYGGGSAERGFHRFGEGARFIPPCAIDRLFLVSPPRPTDGPDARR